MTSSPQPAKGARRASDRGPLNLLTARLVRWSDDQWDSVAAGRVLLLVTGLITTATAPLMHLDEHSWICLGIVGAAMLGVMGVSYLLPWARLPRATTLVFPFAVWAALAGLGFAAHGLGANFTGMTAISFAYIGLTQPTAWAIRVTPLAGLAYVGAYGRWSPQLVSRLPIAVAVWLLLAVLLAELIVRQQGLTERLRVAANTDSLTGVCNRRDLGHRLITVEPGDTLAICDLDHFKRINDGQGHAAGDRVLADFGLALLSGLRDGDYVARYGGEEFALVFPGTSGPEALAALRRLRTTWGTLQPDVTFSAGLAEHTVYRTPAETLEAADLALYSAKTAGRNRDIIATSDREIARNLSATSV